MSDRKLSLTLFIVTVVSILTILSAAIWNAIERDVRGQLSHGTEFRIWFNGNCVIFSQFHS